jgi:hypothetical protein
MDAGERFDRSFAVSSPAVSKTMKGKDNNVIFSIRSSGAQIIDYQISTVIQGLKIFEFDKRWLQWLHQ